jgi:hypothetical protein
MNIQSNYVLRLEVLSWNAVHILLQQFYTTGNVLIWWSCNSAKSTQEPSCKAV